MLVAAVCPQPPLLVPELAPGVDKAIQRLRDTSADAVRRLTWSATSRIVVVAGAEASGRWRSDAGGSLAPYGVDVRAGGPVPVLPLSLTLGAWLLDQAGWNEAREYVAVASDVTAVDAMAVGAQLVSEDESLGLLVLGDGSAKRATTSPGYLDERAEAFDASVAAALAAADVEALIGLDATLADELWVAGRAAWHVLAGAGRVILRHTQDLRGSLEYDEAPFGVGYFVASWQTSAG